MSLFNHEQYYMLLFVYVCFSLTTPLVRTVIFTYIHTYILLPIANIFLSIIWLS